METAMVALLLGGLIISLILPGLLVVVRVAVNVQAAYGPEWGMAALGSGLVVLGALASVCWWYQDYLVGMATGLLRRSGPQPEHVYCLTCGAAAPLDAPACEICGGVRLGFTPPGAAAGACHVQIGMDVLGQDAVAIGSVKWRRKADFLVDRPHRRDVYVPYSAIDHGTREAVTLSVPSAGVDTSGWKRPPRLPRLRA